jgi:hypothetical protein
VNWLALPTIVLIAITAGGPGQAQEAKDSESDRRLKFMQSAAAEYAVQTDAGKELPLHTEPLLRFNNPVSGMPDGSVEERYGKSSERGLYHVWVHSREVVP